MSCGNTKSLHHIKRRANVDSWSISQTFSTAHHILKTFWMLKLNINMLKCKKGRKTQKRDKSPSPTVSEWSPESALQFPKDHQNLLRPPLKLKYIQQKSQKSWWCRSCRAKSQPRGQHRGYSYPSYPAGSIIKEMYKRYQCYSLRWRWGSCGGVAGWPPIDLQQEDKGV